MTDRRQCCSLGLFAVLLLVCLTQLQMASANVPTINEVVVWDNGGNTTLNVTVFHLPQTTIHFVNFIQVNVSGDLRDFPAGWRPETTFTVICDLGVMEVPLEVTVRAHCNQDGYSGVYGPIVAPELIPVALLTVLLGATSIFALQKKQRSTKSASPSS